jgi:Pectate lyase superfamily protein
MQFPKKNSRFNKWSSVFFISILFISFSNHTCFSQTSTVNVKDFGAVGDGVHDDGPAIQKALDYCVKNNLPCFIPKTGQYYKVGETIRVLLTNGQSLKISSDHGEIEADNPLKSTASWNLTSFRQHVLISIGPNQATADYHTAFMNNNVNSSVSIQGLVFDGSSFPYVSGTQKYDADIIVGLQTSTENVTVQDCIFQNFFGYAMQMFGSKYADIDNDRYIHVGGRGQTVVADKADYDAMGDAIYNGFTKPDAEINIQNCILKGDVVHSIRSRDGITFEYSLGPFNIHVSNCDISGFAKCIHIEEKYPLTANIDSCNFSDFNLAIANITDNGATCNVDHCNFNIGVTDGKDGGDDSPFLTMYGHPKIYVTNSTFSYADAKRQDYQTMTGVELLKGCTINAFGTNPVFTDGNTVFDNCRFVDFGGPSNSFYSFGNKSNFVIKNSDFSGGNVFTNNKNVKLNFVNCLAQTSSVKLINSY